MNKSPATLTVPGLETWARQQDLTKSNPTDLFGACVYNGENGTHCIAGQLFADYGIEIPESMNSFDVINLILSLDLEIPTETAKVLSKLQGAADGGTHRNDGVGGAWGSAVAIVFGSAS